MSVLDLLVGRPLASDEARGEQIGSWVGIPVFGLDALSSAAYGPEAALTLLIPLGAAGIAYIVPISMSIIVLLTIVYFSYRQTIQAYPGGGGSYTVARQNLGVSAGLLAAAALMIDYILVVAVGISAGVGALVSAVPRLQPHTLSLCLGILVAPSGLSEPTKPSMNEPPSEAYASGFGGSEALPLQMDIRKMEQISSAVDQTAKEFGRVDVLVNNAGIAPENLAEDVREEDFDATLAVNLKGTFFASQAAGRLMIRQKSGTIINMSSQAGFAALPTESIYCMTKAGIVHLTKCLAVEWGKYGITVNAVAPTFIRTPGTESALSDAAFHADTLERIAALHRIGEPMEVAGAVVFLASPAASLITGETILIDGGWTAR